jgi:cytochrome c peroxidase
LNGSGRRLALLLLTLAWGASMSVGSAAQLSPQAQLGRLLFSDMTLSASGKLSCASCHDPANAYGAPTSAGVVMRGGAKLDRFELRSVPSLRYMTDTPRFTRHGYRDTGSEREDVGPAGGFMLDGRADSLREQALLPLLDPAEMANSSIDELAKRLRNTPYAPQFARAFATAATDSQSLAGQAAMALERFEEEDPSFHPYSSRFDQYLHGAQSLSAEELAGLRLFADPAKGNCAACHTVTTGPQGRAPDFTDRSYHALGVPRNPAIAANGDSRFFDLGLCGPARIDLRRDAQYCGYFKTPTLRNTARRRFYFHNGRFTNLQDVLHFYVERDTDTQRWYPRTGRRALPFDDLPRQYRGNVNMSDAPLNRRRGDRPALDDTEIGEVIAFLKTLSDAD